MQSKVQSFIEANANTFSGTIINWVAGMLIYPMFGLSVTMLDVTGITMIFTLLSISRNYLVRRFFVNRNNVVTERKTYYLCSGDCDGRSKIPKPHSEKPGKTPHPHLQKLFNRET